MKPEDVPVRLIDAAMADAAPGCRDDAAFYLANALPEFDRATRAAIVRWIEAQTLTCPQGHDDKAGHDAMCAWCWRNGTLRKAAMLASGHTGPTPALVLDDIAKESR